MQQVVRRNSKLVNFTVIITMTDSQTDEILFKDFGRRGLVTLNRPKHLNSLNNAMLLNLYAKLKQWDRCKDLIVVKSSTPKAFCVGGDIVGPIINDKSGETIRRWTRSEYMNAALIASLKVPYLSIIQGIVIGGGVGISIHGKYRVATETSIFAMPETAIGFTPDIGVSHFFSRMPNKLGLFLGLTGYKLKGFDLWHTGIATHFCHSSLIADLEKEILQADAKVEAVLSAFHSISVDMLPHKSAQSFSLSAYSEIIEHCFSAPTAGEIVTRLQNINNEFTKEVSTLIQGGCPISIKITFQQIKKAASLDLYEVFNMDYRVAWRLFGEENFFEGVRALLIDKDKKPLWSKKCIEDVNDEEVEKYFQKLGKENELNVPFSLLKSSL